MISFFVATGPLPFAPCLQPFSRELSAPSLFVAYIEIVRRGSFGRFSFAASTVRVIARALLMTRTRQEGVEAVAFSG